MSLDLPLVRTVRATDLSLVFDSWLKGWRTSKYAGVIPNNLYFDTQRALIEDLIARGARIVVAHPPDNDDKILGWACGEQKDNLCVLHYIYTKTDVSRVLLDALPGAKPGFITHRLPDKEFRTWKWIPELARRKAL